MIPIYSAEKEIPGLADLIKANCSIAYTSKFLEVKDDSGLKDSLSKLIQSKASMNDADLFYTKSILVSTNWNANDDVFTNENVWAAKDTPAHKRTNIEHDEKKIVGHMTEVWPIDPEGNIIASDTSIDELPDMFHLVNGSVIYRIWQDKEYQKVVAELIENIVNGDMYVSMECLFSDFDYAVEKNGEFYSIARNADSAFLTKKLKAYGGDGKYEGAKLGRIPKNIIFSGKGFVVKPANKNSIILGDDDNIKASHFSSAKLKDLFKTEVGVLNTSANVKNTENNNIMNEEQIKAMQDEVKSLQASNKVLADQVAKFEGESKASAEYKTASEKEVAQLKAQVLDLTKANTDLEKAVTEQKAQAQAIARASKLVSVGCSEDEAKAKVQIFAGLSDAQFEAIAGEIAEAKKKKDDKNADMDDDDEDDKKAKAKKEEEAAAAAAKALENAKPTENAAASPSPNTDSENKTREQLRTAIASLLGYKVEEEKN